MDKIKLAAIKRESDSIVFTGRNHAEIILTRPKGELTGSEQGFITEANEFVSRKRAGKIAFTAGQIDKPTEQLFSEDITGEWPWAKEQIAQLQSDLAKAKEEYTGLRLSFELVDDENEKQKEQAEQHFIDIVALTNEFIGFHKVSTDKIDQLQAENKELREVFSDYPDLMKRLTKHSKELKAELERLKDNDCVNIDCSNHVQEVLLEKEQLQAELAKHHWIPVGERLPEKTEEDLRPEVLVYDGESVTGALWRHYSFGWDFETDRGEPTHWKPIILPDSKERKK